MQLATINISKQIPGLNGLRGVAALIVVLSHASIRQMHLAPGLDFGGIGKAGVYLFFVLSAMLLTSQMLDWESKDYLKPGHWFHYFQRRVFRVWPLFILALLVSLGTKLYGPDLISDRGVPSIISTDNFFPALFLTENVPLLWTIAAEFKFYFLLPVICFVLQTFFRNSLVPSLLFLIPVIWIAYGLYPPESSSVSPLPFLSLFLSGVICALVYHSIRINNNRLIIAIEFLAWMSILAFIATIPSIYGLLTGVSAPKVLFHESHILYAIIWSTLILSMLYGTGWLRQILDAKPLAFIGKISYSLYIWHLVVLILVYRGLDYSPVAKGWISVTGAIVLATVSYYLIERPVLRWSASLGQPGKHAHQKA